MLVMRVGGVEQVFEREEVDVIQRDEEGGAPAPQEDEDRQDRVCPRQSRLRRLAETRGPSTFRAGSAGSPASRTTSSIVQKRMKFAGRIARCIRVCIWTRVTVPRQ